MTYGPSLANFIPKSNLLSGAVNNAIFQNLTPLFPKEKINKTYLPY
jgi:hypothetical protein